MVLFVVGVAILVLVWVVFDKGRPPARPGDINGDGILSRADADALSAFVMGSGEEPEGSGDVNGDGKVDVMDVLYLVNHVSGKGAAPVGWATPTPTPVP